MGGHALAAQQQLHAVLREPRLQHLAHQRMGHAVAVAVDLDVVIDVDLHGLEAREFVALRGQRHQGRLVQLGEHAGAAAGQFLEGAVVHAGQQLGDGRIDLRDGVEAVVAQPRQHPATHDLDRTFCGGFVLWRTWPCREHRGAVVAGEVLHRVVGARLVAVGRRDHRCRVVRHHELRHAAVEVQRAHHAGDPVFQALRGRCAGEHTAGSGHGRDEDLGAGAVAERHRRAGVVDEHLFPSTTVLAHRALERGREGLVVLAELRVAPGAALRVGGQVFLPQQHQRHALAVELAVDAGPVRNDDGKGSTGARLQSRRELLLAPILDGVPVQARGGGQADVLGDDALGDLQGGGDLLVRELRVPLQADDIFDHA
ncbi:hypothetical protein ROSA5918_05155 [Roseateles saccharophilus]